MRIGNICVVAAFALSSQSFAGELVIVGNPAIQPLTREEVSDIFLGKNQSLNPVDQADSGGSYAEFYKKATGREVSQVKSTWSRIVFSGKGQPPKQLPDSNAVKKAVAIDPKGVGYIEKAAVDSSVKVLITLE